MRSQFHDEDRQTHICFVDDVLNELHVFIASNNVMRRKHEYGMWWMCSVFLFTSSYSMSRRALPNMTSSTRCTPRYYQFSIRMFASSAEVSQTIAFRCKDIVFLCFHCSQQCSESSAPLLLQAQDQHMNRVTVTQCS